MTSFEPYKLDLTPNFRSWVTRLKKNHYRKLAAEQAAFEDFLTSFFEQVETAPHTVPSSRVEPWPAKCYDARFKFYKKDFKMPGLSGASGQGRIMWLVCDETRTAHIIWVYTHDEFKKRPEDKELRSHLQDAMGDAMKALEEMAGPDKTIQVRLPPGTPPKR